MNRAPLALAAILVAGVAVPVSNPFALLALVPIYLAGTWRFTILGTVAVGAAIALHDLAWDLAAPSAPYAPSLALCLAAGALGMSRAARRAHAARERELLADRAA